MPITHPAARLLFGKANAPLTPKSILVLFRTNKGRGREVQGGVGKAQRSRKEKEGGGIGSRGRGEVLGAVDDDGWGPNDRAADAPPSAFERGGPLPAPVTIDHNDHDTTIKQHTGERGRRKMVRQWLAVARDDGGGGNGTRALLGQ